MKWRDFFKKHACILLKGIFNTLAIWSFVCWVPCNLFSLDLQLVRDIFKTETWFFQPKFAKFVYVSNRCLFTIVRNLKTLRSSTGLVRNSFSNLVENVWSKFPKKICWTDSNNLSLKIRYPSQTVPLDTESALLTTGQRFYSNLQPFAQVSEEFEKKKNFPLLLIAPLVYSTNLSKNASDNKTFFKELGTKWNEEVFSQETRLHFIQRHY